MSLSSAFNNLTGYSSSAAATANGISAAAQNAAAAFNSQQAAQQMAYQTQSMQAQQAYNSAMWQQMADYNAQEAQKNREWQEYMSNTAYQRTIEDMIKAGINPILAAQNGANAWGNGGQASASLASSGLQSGASGAITGYQGEMENTSTKLALIGAIGGALSEITSGLKEAFTGLNSISDYNITFPGMDQLAKAIGDIFGDGEASAKAIREERETEEKYKNSDYANPKATYWINKSRQFPWN